MSGAISLRRPYALTAFKTLPSTFTKDTCTVHVAAGPQQLLVSHNVYTNSETTLPALSAQIRARKALKFALALGPQAPHTGAVR